MEYYARFSVIQDGYGLMGIHDETFEADSIEELAEELQEFYIENETNTIMYMLDEIEDEEGNEIDKDLLVPKPKERNPLDEF